MRCHRINVLLIMHWKLCIILFGIAAFKCIQADESQFSINNNKAIQLVNERFVSFSVDPSIFFSGLSHRPIILKLIEHITPAFLRIAGPSTHFLEFNVDELKATKIIADDSTSLTFSPPMWWSFNEWIQKTNFTPIFALNDENKVDGKWDPKRALPLLDMTAKMNINCIWQLGFDCADKGFDQYKEDLTTLRHILDAFPNKKDNWQIVGSDLSKCIPSDHTEILRMYLADLQDTDAVMWENDESLSASLSFLGGNVMQKLLSHHQASLPVWLSTPKNEHPIKFEDGINWAVEMGEAAKNGFNVIFREPRVQEYYSTTPAYWVTVLHKNLMGRNVLDVKMTSLTHTDAYIYAHCSKDQNSYSVRGAMTVMIANNGSEPHKAAFRIPTQIKSVEVRSYILTTNENNMDTYLNGEKLSLDEFKILPKLRRAKVLTHLMLTIPPKSIGFFELPGAKIPICIDNEDDTNLILDEIDKIQEVDFPESGKSTGLFSRLNIARSSLSLADLHRKLENEFKTDAALIPKLKLKSIAPTNDEWRQQLTVKMKQKSDTNEKKSLFDESRVNDMKILFDKAKTDVKIMDLKNLLKKDNERKDDVLGMSKPKLDLDLSSAEVLKILGDRAKVKLEKKVGLTDLDGLFEKALRGRFKRDINMALLEEKVHDQEQKASSLITHKKKMKQKLEKFATAREPEDEIEGLPDMSKIIPGIDKIPISKASPYESIFANKHSIKPKMELFGFETLDIPSLFSLLASKTSTTTTTTTQKPSFNEKPDLYAGANEFEKEIGELEEDLNGHHNFFEHFGDSVRIQPKKKHHDFHELGAAWDYDDGILDNEFIINDENDVPGAIKKLENYFNHPSRSGSIENVPMKHSSRDYFDPAFDSFESFGRFKRGLYLRQSQNQQRGYSTNKFNQQRPVLLKKSKLFPRSYNANEILNKKELNNKISEHQKAFLKTRLAHRKLLESNDSLLQLFNRIRRESKIRNKNEEIYIPKSNITNKIFKSYESKLNWKKWRPEGVLHLPKQYGILKIGQRKDQISFDDIPVRANGLLGKINSRNARHVDGDINSVENAIDDFLNTIEKDTKFIKPLLDKESGEYTIVFPTHDKLSLLQQKNGDTEIVLHRDTEKQTAATEDTSSEKDDCTCLATDPIPTAKELQAQEDKTTIEDTTLEQVESTTINNHKKENVKGSTEIRIDRSQYVQKIPLKDKKLDGNDDPANNNTSNFDFVHTIVHSFSKFIKKVHDKIDTFFKTVE